MDPPFAIGRYLVHDEFAAGGTASVHFGRMTGPAGFVRRVAIKRLHPQYAKDPDLVAMLLDEARIAARIQHPNVVSTIDVVTSEGEVFLVMEYAHGESLARLLRAAELGGDRIPPAMAAALMAGVLHGLHAAHETKGIHGEALNVVHRDVSPQNILVGADGVPKILDFGIAKAIGRARTTRDGKVKGKLAYMAPEQLLGRVSARTDVYAASVVLWEMLTGRRLFPPDHFDRSSVPRSSSIVSEIPAALDDVVMRGLHSEPEQRFGTAREMAISLEGVGGVVAASVIGDWVSDSAGTVLQSRLEILEEMESAPPAIPTRLHAVAATLAAGERTETMTQASPASIPSRPTRRAAWTLASAIAVLVLGGAMLVVTRSPRRPPRVTVEAPPKGFASPPVAQPEVAATSEEVPQAPAVTSRAAPAIPRRAGAARPTTRCEVPFRIDANGRKIPKPECF